MHRWLFAFALLACQRTETKPEPPPAKPAPVVATPKRGEPIDVHGIVVTFRDDGTVAIRGRDRFGAALDTVYENVDFFRNALPVLDQSLTAEQSMGLRELVTPR
ncbi:MAG: hypothetical protein JO257_22970 [Deltaproteobacteria bacterium]|nr:hypothetical protein [Deltaproteobacteria bacterium]